MGVVSTTAARTPSMASNLDRDYRIDTLRGLLLVIILVDHLRGGITQIWTYQGLGFFSAAEGFVCISGLVAGMVYVRIAAKAGGAGMAKRAWRRAGQIYLWHVAVFLVIIAGIILVPAYGEAVTYVMFPEYFREDPLRYILSYVVLLQYPMFFAILPIYIIFLLFLPLVIFGLDRVREGVVAASFLVWLGAQMGFNAHTAAMFVDSPFVNAPWFDPTAWQFLFVIGLWCGWRYVHGQRVLVFNPALVGMAACFCAIMFLARWDWIRLPGIDAAALQLQGSLVPPLRLLNFLAFAYLIAWCCWRWVPRTAGIPGLTLLGQHSLEVFSFHLLIVYSLGLSLPVWAAIIPLPLPAAVVIVTLELGAIVGLLLFAISFRRMRRFGYRGSTDGRPVGAVTQGNSAVAADQDTYPGAEGSPGNASRPASVTGTSG